MDPIDQPATAKSPRWFAAPTRIIYGLPGLKSRTTTGGPTRPDLRNPDLPRRRAEVPATKISPKRLAAVERQVAASIDGLHPVANPEPGLPKAPLTLDAMQTEQGFRKELDAMFGGGPAATQLADRVLAALPPAAPGESSYIVPLVLATALKSVGIETADYAAVLLDAILRGDESREVFRLERLLASSAEGTAALAHCRRWPADETARRMKRDSLLIASDLELKGFPVGGHASAAGVAHALRTDPALHLGHAVGTDRDAPLQLLAQALLHAQGQGSAAHLPAYVAWKKGGFTESGKGTAFNRAIRRLHKFVAYADRADHGPRTLGNLARDAAAQVRRMFGVGKSPLTQTRHGTLGGGNDMLHVEAARFQERLQVVQESAEGLLVDEMKDAAFRGDVSLMHKALAQAAVLQAWRSTGDAKIPVDAILERADLIRAGVTVPGYSENALRKALHSFAGRMRDDQGRRAIRIGLPVLEAVGSAVRKRVVGRPAHGTMAVAPADLATADQQIRRLRESPGRTALQEAELAALMDQRRRNVMALLDDLGATRRGRAPGNPLFKFSDLKRLLRGTPRHGPTAADAHQVMRSLASAKFISETTFSDESAMGAGTFGALSFSWPTLGAPLAYPVAALDIGKKAAVTVGVSPTGGRLTIGTERSTAVTLGGGGGWGIALPKVPVSALLLAEKTVTRQAGRGESIAITTRNDLEGWQEKLPLVVDFLFEQAQQARADGAASCSPSDLWTRFATKFGDDPHIAVGWNEEATSGVSDRLVGMAAARAQVGKTTSIGPTLSAGFAVNRQHFRRMPHADGGDVPIEYRNRGTTASLAATLMQTVPAAALAADPLAGWGMAVPLAGAALEWNISGSLGLARLGRTRDGRLSAALCQREQDFVDGRRLIELGNHERERWERAMVEKDATHHTTPAQARELVNRFLGQVASVPSRSDQLHGQILTLSPRVAEHVNRLEARMRTIRGTGDGVAISRALSARERDECRRIENEAHRLLQEPGSWEPSSIYSLEFNQVGSTTGLDFGLRAVNRERTRAARLTTLMIAGVPDV